MKYIATLLFLSGCSGIFIDVKDCSYTEYVHNMKHIQSRKDAYRLLKLYKTKSSETGSSSCFFYMVELRDWICFLENDRDCRLRGEY